MLTSKSAITQANRTSILNGTLLNDCKHSLLKQANGAYGS